MPDQTEVIRCQIRDTQSDLAQKLGLLEERVAQSVAEAKSAVTTTVETAQEQFRAVTRILDLRPYVREHPWASAAAALGLGFLGARLLGAGGTNSKPNSEWLGEAAKTYLAELKPFAIGMALGLVRETLKQGIPEEFRDGMAEIIDDTTVRLGGMVVREGDTVA